MTDWVLLDIAYSHDPQLVPDSDIDRAHVLEKPTRFRCVSKELWEEYRALRVRQQFLIEAIRVSPEPRLTVEPHTP